MAKKEMHAYMLNWPKELHKRLKIQAVKEDRDMRDIIVELVKDYLKEVENDHANQSQE